jgi:hypothetical protein
MTRRGFNGALCGATAFALSGCAKQPVASRLGAIDSHAHVFHRDLPMPDKRRAPAGYDAPPEDYLRVLAANGMTHGVLVQPSFLGADNSYLVASLRRYPDRLRGIAVVDPSIGSEQLQALQDAGVVGIRLNLIGRGCGRFLGLPGGSSCTHTKTGFEPCSCTSSWASASA